MNRTEEIKPSGRTLSTADLAAAGRQSPPSPDDEEGREERTPRVEDRAARRPESAAEGEGLEPLFPPDTAEHYRSQWSTIQSGFVDDPRQAARQGDELVAQVMRTLAESFAHEREHLERELNQTGEASTEALRVGLRRYRSFFERLLSL